MAREKILPFLKKLRNNNNKEWFDANRPAYEEAKISFIELLEEVIQKFGTIDSSIASIEPKKALFRINRDIRFSKEKIPYKTNMGASLSDGGKKSPKGGYYIHIEPGNSFLAGGIWMPEADTLKKIRQEIEYNGKEFEKILKQKEFVKLFGGLDEEQKLVRPPKEFDANSPYVEYVKLKSFVVVHPIPDSLIVDDKLAAYCTKVFSAMYPLNKFLNVVFD